MPYTPIGQGRGPCARPNPPVPVPRPEAPRCPGTPVHESVKKSQGGWGEVSKDRVDQLSREYALWQSSQSGIQSSSPDNSRSQSPKSSTSKLRAAPISATPEERANHWREECERILERERLLRDFAVHSDSERQRLQKDMVEMQISGNIQQERWGAMRQGDANVISGLVAENRRLMTELEEYKTGHRDESSPPRSSLKEIPSQSRTSTMSYAAAPQEGEAREAAMLRRALEERSEALALCKQQMQQQQQVLLQMRENRCCAETQTTTSMQCIQVGEEAQSVKRDLEARMQELSKIAAERGAQLACIKAEGEQRVRETERQRAALQALREEVTVLQREKQQLSAAAHELKSCRSEGETARRDAQHAEGELREVQIDLAAVRAERDRLGEALAAAQAESAECVAVRAEKEALKGEAERARVDARRIAEGAAECQKAFDIEKASLRGEADDLKEKLAAAQAELQSRSAADVQALLLLREDAKERDGIILELRSEATVLRGRCDQLAHEKEVLMSKLVEERTAVERSEFTRKSSSQSVGGMSIGSDLSGVATTRVHRISALAARDASIQTSPDDEAPSDVVEADEAPSLAGIETLKARIAFHGRKTQELDKVMQKHKEVLSLLRATLQRKLHDEMAALTRDRAVQDGGEGLATSVGAFARDGRAQFDFNASAGSSSQRKGRRQAGGARAVFGSLPGANLNAPRPLRSVSSSPVDVSSGTDSLWPSPPRAGPPAPAPSAGAVAAAAGIPHEPGSRLVGMSGGSMSQSSDGPLPAQAPARSERPSEAEALATSPRQLVEDGIKSIQTRIRSIQEDVCPKRSEEGRDTLASAHEIMSRLLRSASSSQ